jgi:hypothetical protein
MCVAVVSIGRSGTSLVSRILHEVLSVDFGDERDHIPRNHNNPDGYFENREMLELNEQILSAIGGGVLAPPPMDFMDRLPAESAARYVQSAQLKISTYSHGKLRFGWKDPRLSLTFPIWLRAVPGVFPIVVFRNPESVLRSMADQLSTAPEKLDGLWFEYYRRIFHFTRGTPRIVISFDELLADPFKVTTQVATHLGISLEESATRQKLAGIVKLSQIRHAPAQTREFPSYIDRGTIELFSYMRDRILAGKQPDLTDLAGIFAIERRKAA